MCSVNRWFCVTNEKVHFESLFTTMKVKDSIGNLRSFDWYIKETRDLIIQQTCYFTNDVLYSFMHVRADSDWVEIQYLCRYSQCLNSKSEIMKDTVKKYSI